MDKITRIHIAKIPYEADNDAERALKKYLDAIRSELDTDLADETMADIEARITEILSDLGINRNDVITIKEVRAIQNQLGSPRQFNSNDQDDLAVTDKSGRSRRLFRDTDNALIGGVCSGLGTYLKIDANIIRIVFILLVLVSGIGILIYLFLWLLVPAARTNSDRLLMLGEPVTVANLQHYRNSAKQTISSLRLQRFYMVLFKLIRVLLTVADIALILGLLILIGIATSALYTQPLSPIYTAYHLNYLLFGLLWLLIVSLVGLLVVVLLRLWQKRSVLLRVTGFTLLGIIILSIAGISITSPFVVSNYKNLYGGDKLSRPIQINGASTGSIVNNLYLNANQNLDVSYIITGQPMHATYQSYPGMGQPDISIVNKKGNITVSATKLSEVVPNCVLSWCKNIYLPVKVNIYGPTLQKIYVNGGAEMNLSSFDQTNLSLVSSDNSNINLYNGYSETLNLTANSNSYIWANGVTAKSSNVTVDSTSEIYGPDSASLAITFPTGCYQPLLTLDQDPEIISINGQSITVQDFNNNSCLNINNPTPAAPNIPPTQP